MSVQTGSVVTSIRAMVFQGHIRIASFLAPKAMKPSSPAPVKVRELMRRGMNAPWALMVHSIVSTSKIVAVKPAVMAMFAPNNSDDLFCRDVRSARLYRFAFCTSLPFRDLRVSKNDDCEFIKKL